IMAAVKYDLIIDYAVRLMGSGSFQWTFAVLGIFGVLVFIYSFFWQKRRSYDAVKTQPDKLF
ncbi:MAG: hypothetical protein L3J67_14025, partial [Hyphomicrobiaceae bacterium]|nr:hypothetical protein [Hyphomicrobiaceae bacterium]